MAVGLVLSLAVAAWLVGSRVRSSDQAAADAAPPERSIVSAPVEFRVLASSVVARGDVVPAVSTQVRGPQPEDGFESLVTGVFVNPDGEVAEGERVIEVAGRPVFVLEGSSPAYRALKPGMRGEDVAELQAALTRLGCDAGRSGLFDEATKLCVASLYMDAGYEVVLSSDSEAADLAESRRAVSDAADELSAAEAELAEATAGPTSDELHDAEVAVAAAERESAGAQAERDRSVAEAEVAVDDALAELNGQLVAANPSAAPAAPAPPGATAASPSPAPASSSGSGASSSAAARRDALANVRAAMADVDVVAWEGADAIASAQEAVGSAQSNLVALTSPPDATTESAAVERQRQRVAEASQDLANLERVSGPTVPLGEAVFVPSLPAAVDRLNAVAGQATTVGVPGQSEAEISGSALNPTESSPLLVLSSAGLQVDVSVNPSDRQLLQPGMDVELIEEFSGASMSGDLASIGDEPTAADGGGDQIYRAVVVADIPRTWSGRNIRVTFIAAATEVPELVVPLAAVSAGADGRARVELLNEDGSTIQIDVIPGLSADGFVAVTPMEDGSLVEGNKVVVGR